MSKKECFEELNPIEQVRAKSICLDEWFRGHVPGSYHVNKVYLAKRISGWMILPKLSQSNDSQ